ncbi:MAG: MmcQ/YjbR family DNA-binding protein [Weeksellaceae bacterium]|jgi:predicted DNA-binding protein (MmcQ/YjbR family)|nr:MmcQ/YjbR family DNA-binding protein [Weeksellaceae bacterium]MDX9705563.1 MmcQ/YjbR family DNA-binding protein [Weeksellaceae bacterium]
MNIEEFREFCLKKSGVTEEFPFGLETLVFKVAGKIFALTGLDSPVFTVNLKCKPNYSEELRENHPEVQPGYHMNKKHWNTVNFEGNLPEELLTELINHSYDLVVKSLSKSVRNELNI